VASPPPASPPPTVSVATLQISNIFPGPLHSPFQVSVALSRARSPSLGSCSASRPLALDRAMSDKDLYRLELLSLVSRISQEILNHTAINDKSLAEFVISLHQKSKTLAEFKAKLDEVGAGFEPAFIETLE
jgi:hypothetical protein